MVRRFLPIVAIAGAAALVPLAYELGEQPAPAADHLEPAQRTNPANDSTPDRPADIADIYVFHTAATITFVLTFGGPQPTDLPGRYDPNVLYTINVSNADPRTTPNIPITFQFGSASGSANGPYGIRVRGVPGTGDIVGSVERTIEQDGVKVRAALVDDPFFFDSQGLRESREMGTLRFRNDRDFFAAQNITSVVIEVPRNRIENGTHVLDVWPTADRLGGQL
jgi:hypothetical protein